MKLFKGMLIALLIMIIGAVSIKLVTIEYSNKESMVIEVKDKYIKRIKDKDIYGGRYR